MERAPIPKRLIIKSPENTEESLRAFAGIIDELNALIAEEVEGCEELISVTLAFDDSTLRDRGLTFVLSISMESDVEQSFLPTEVFIFSESISCGKRASSIIRGEVSEYRTWNGAILMVFHRLQFAVSRLYWRYERLAHILEQVVVKELWDDDTMEAADWLVRCPRAFNEESLQTLARDIDALNKGITAVTGRTDEVFSMMLATDMPEDPDDEAFFIISMDFEPESAFITLPPKFPLFVTYAFHYDGNYEGLPNECSYFVERVNGQTTMRGIYESEVIENSTFNRARCIAELLAERYRAMLSAISCVWFE